MNYVKGLAILYTFLVVVGMVGVLESQALIAYGVISGNRYAQGFGILGSTTVGIFSTLRGILTFTSYAAGFEAAGWGLDYFMAPIVAGEVAGGGLLTSEGIMGIFFGIAAALPVWGWAVLGIGMA